MIAATDYMRSFADQIRPWVDAPYRVLGTDGYGRSDYRKTLRSFFEVDRHHVALAALTELAKAGDVDAGRAQEGDRVLRHRPRAARAVAGVREATVAGTEQVLVPDIGDFDDVPVIEVLVSVGDEVAAEDPLVVLESDKATMEVPSPSAGKVAAIEVAVGDKVKEGSPILSLEVSGGNGASAETAPAGAVAEDARGGGAKDVEAAIQEPRSRTRRAARPYARVAAGRHRRGARLRVARRAPPGARARRRPLEPIRGSGRKGRITKEDVQKPQPKEPRRPQPRRGRPRSPA